MSVRAFTYPRPLTQAFFLKRYKRFFADVYLKVDTKKTVFASHCANSGSMKSCIEKETDAFVYDSENPERKLRYSLEALKLEDGYACLNTQRANQVLEGLMNQRSSLSAQSFKGADLFTKDFGTGQFRCEAKYSARTRFDGIVSAESSLKETAQRHWIEVKSVSLRLSAECIAFPDAVTKRGEKHLLELAECVQAGERATLIFAVMRGQNIDPLELKEQFQIARQIDPRYHAAALKAQIAGVQFRLMLTSINETGIDVRGYFRPRPFQ